MISCSFLPIKTPSPSSFGRMKEQREKKGYRDGESKKGVGGREKGDYGLLVAPNSYSDPTRSLLSFVLDFVHDINLLIINFCKSIRFYQLVSIIFSYDLDFVCGFSSAIINSCNLIKIHLVLQ